VIICDIDESTNYGKWLPLKLMDHSPLIQWLSYDCLCGQIKLDNERYLWWNFQNPNPTKVGSIYRMHCTELQQLWITG